MRFLLVAVLYMSSALCFSQPSEPQEFTGQGKLVILRIIPGDKTAKLFVVGRKAAELDLKKETKVLSVFLNLPQSNEELRVNDRGDYYEISGVPQAAKPFTLSIKTKTKNEVEDINVLIRQKKIP